MTETARIADQLARAFNGDAWSGPSLQATLQGITAEQAASRPVPAAHSIWELVLHLATWARVVHARVSTGQEQPVPDDVDWPAVPAATPEAWAQAQEALVAAHTQVIRLLSTLTDEQLSQPVGRPDTDVTVYVLLHGLAQHYLYHAGQVALLRKALPA